MTSGNNGVNILGIGKYTPSLRITNTEFAKYIDTSDEWIKTRTGIDERYLNVGMTNLHMAENAAKSAMDNASVTAEEIDMIIATTCTPDYLYPGLSCLIQRKIGAGRAVCLDLNMACTGFIAAFDLARVYLSLGEYKKILIVSSENLSSQIDFTDRATCVLFGDGAGALVVEKSDKPYASYIGAEGEDIDNCSLYYKINYKKNYPFSPIQNNIDENQVGFLKMDGKAVYKFAIEAMPKAVKRSIEKMGIDISEIDLLIPHQANIRIIKTAAQTLGISLDKVYTNIELYGNTSSACIPICLDDLKKSGRLKEGMKICFVGFGGGLMYGSICMEI